MLGAGVMMVAMVQPVLGQTELLEGDLVVGSRQFGAVYGLLRDSGLLNGHLTGPDMQSALLPVRGAGPTIAASGGHLALLVMPTTRQVLAFPGESNRWGVYRIDFATGDRSLLPGTDGPLWASSGDMLALDPDTILVLGSDFAANAAGVGKLLRYKISTGVTTVISSDSRGDGPVIHRPRSIARTGINTVAIVEFGPVNTSLPGAAVYSVDLTTGDRSVISTLTAVAPPRYLVTGGVISADRPPVPLRGQGPYFTGQHRGLAYLDGRLFVSSSLAQPFAGAIVEIDLATGDRTLLVGTAETGSGRTTVNPGPGSDAVLPDSPTGLQKLRSRSLVFSGTFGPNLIWEFNIDSRAVTALADFNPQIDPTFQSNMRFSGLAVVPQDWCPADIDDGTGRGVTDGGIGIEDLLLYTDLYTAGSVWADVDDGSGSGTRDGGVGIEDLLYYLVRYEAGC